MSISGYYDIRYIENVSKKIIKAYPEFKKDHFIEDMEVELNEQTYTEKMIIVANALNKYIPSYGKALEIFHAMLGRKMTSMSETYDLGMEYAPFGKYVELFAVQNEACFEKTVGYIYELTQRYTGEFAMRPLLKAFPERTLEVIKKWTDDKSDCVRRLCSECMRVAIPWAPKLNFALERFDECAKVLIKLASDECEYVRRSVANNLNELCKVDMEKAKYLIEKISEIDDSKNIKKLITHGTRWARKKGYIRVTR